MTMKYRQMLIRQLEGAVVILKMTSVVALLSWDAFFRIGDHSCVIWIQLNLLERLVLVFVCLGDRNAAWSSILLLSVELHVDQAKCNSEL
jgi:hypothetical protein